MTALGGYKHEKNASTNFMKFQRQQKTTTMSRKNNKAHARKRHEFELQKEKVNLYRKHVMKTILPSYTYCFKLYRKPMKRRKST